MSKRKGVLCYTVMWKSVSMTAPAFWYFLTRNAADEAVTRLLDQGCTAVRYLTAVPHRHAGLIEGYNHASR